ncbi:FUSC family protein [Micromonospora sp. NPDC004540]|uniref:FUSC family protein n=1 Tax=Micromonospora sp. NPDC004540 TaxID=3154457 RepID=UPI0033B10894
MFVRIGSVNLAMAPERRDPPRSGAAASSAKGLVAQARRHGGEAGRLRLRMFEIILVIAAQCGLAAALSWALAHEVLNRPAPIFAPSAAVGTIVGALGQRTRRTVELLLGVGLGLIVSDLLLRSVGFGLWQIGVVVALSIAVALFMTGRSGALVAQAGGTAVLIATFSQVEEGLEWKRVVDAGVGAVVGLTVVALLLPVNPIRLLHRAIGLLAEAIQLLVGEARAGRPFDQTRKAALDGARLAGQAYRSGVKPFSDAIVIQLRTLASDLLRATGCEPETANRMVREAATS